MKKSTVMVGLVILMMGGMLAACRGTRQAETAKETAVLATPVKVTKAAKQRISETLTYTGTFEAGEKINITPETAGKVAKIYVEEGQFVSKGQLLAELDTESIRLQLKQAEAGLAVAWKRTRNGWTACSRKRPSRTSSTNRSNWDTTRPRPSSSRPRPA
jgi:multidrug efflux pump subunit AcrA (membrane-fusion protein)